MKHQRAVSINTCSYKEISLVILILHCTTCMFWFAHSKHIYVILNHCFVYIVSKHLLWTTLNILFSHPSAPTPCALLLKRANYDMSVHVPFRASLLIFFEVHSVFWILTTVQLEEQLVALTVHPKGSNRWVLFVLEYSTSPSASHLYRW